MSDDLFTEILSALQGLGVTDFCVDEGTDVIERIKHDFVDGNPQAWWWDSFKNKTQTFIYKDNKAYLHITEIAPYKNCKVWFIADSGDEMFIFDINIDDLPKILAECRYFEYYIVPHDCSWIMAENHHGGLFLSTKITLS